MSSSYGVKINRPIIARSTPVPSQDPLTFFLPKIYLSWESLPDNVHFIATFFFFLYPYFLLATFYRLYPLVPHRVQNCRAQLAKHQPSKQVSRQSAAIAAAGLISEIYFYQARIYFSLSLSFFFFFFFPTEPMASRPVVLLQTNSYSKLSQLSEQVWFCFCAASQSGRGKDTTTSIFGRQFHS